MNICIKSIKRVLLLLLAVIASPCILAQNISIPDANFKVFCVANYDTSGDSEISTTEAAAVTGTMDCHDMTIADLTGLEYFINLQSLYCYDNQLTSLPALTTLTSLQSLLCYDNQLTSLPDLTTLTSLEYLYCHHNQLTSLPDLAALTSLTDLGCRYNQLTSLPSLATLTNLEYLYCQFNQLTSLPDLTGLTKLKQLYCNDNQLTSFPVVSTLTNLKRLYCYNNQLTSLPALDALTGLEQLYCNDNLLTVLPSLTVLTSLQSLHCNSNQLTSLPDLTTLINLQTMKCYANLLTNLPSLTLLINLEILDCYNNQLTSLPALSTLTNLQRLYCYNNQLTSLPDLTMQTNLRYLHCYNNQLTSLPDLTTLTSLLRLRCNNNQLTDLPDITNLTSFDYLRIYDNNLDYDDCPDIATIEALNLSEFIYNPQKGGSILDCSCIPARIGAHPVDSSCCPGDSVTFSVTASGAEPLAFQWRMDFNVIVGATSSSYTLASISSANAGSYDCVVTNSCGSETSNPAVLTVGSFPSQAHAGPDKQICAQRTSLEANTPVDGQGEWSILVGGTATIVDSNDPHTQFSGEPGDYLLEWRISTACGASSDTVSVTIPSMTWDVFIINNGPDETYFNDGAGNFSMDNTFGSQFSTSVDLGDVDGDGFVDAFITGNIGVTHKLWINDGVGGFTQSGESFGGGSSQISLAAQMVDLDNDGDMDIFLTRTNISPNSDQVYFNDGLGHFTLSSQDLGAGNTYSVASGDIDGDGDTDLITGGASIVNIWLNDGTGTLSSGGSLPYGIAYALVCGDMDQDGDLDLFTGGNGANKVWFNDGTGVFSDSAQMLGTSFTYDAKLADLSLNGSLDLICANSSGQENTVWFNDGNGVFSLNQTLGDMDSFSVDLGDVNQDGYMDAVFGNNGANKLYHNDGSGTFIDSGMDMGSGQESRAVFGLLRGDDGLMTMSELYRQVAQWNQTLTILDLTPLTDNLCLN